jgi:SWI/SNF-related matrix-associated actin-dependent regulator 1 of chromatin subfamily A
MYREDPIISSSPPRVRSYSPDELPGTYITQPTQPLGPRSPLVALPTATQATLPLTPRAHRYQPPSHVQVQRSSPAMSHSQSQSHSQLQQPLASAMAPPGTLPALPPPARRFVYDLTSDDAPVERDPFEDEDSHRSNIPYSKVELSSRTSRVEETPVKAPALDLSRFSHGMYHASTTASTNTNPNVRKRPSAGLQSQAKKQKVAGHQAGPARALPVDLTGDDDPIQGLDDILDFETRRNVQRLSTIFPSRPLQRLYDALVEKKGHYNDALDLISGEESEDELLKSPQFGPTTVKKTAQRTLNAPAQGLMGKYSKLDASSLITPVVPEGEQPKRKGKLRRGRKPKSPSPAASPPPRPQQQPPKRPKIIDHDEEDIDEGIVEISDDDDDDVAQESEEEHAFSETSLVEFFNACSVEEMVDLSNMNEADVRQLLDHRPFTSLDAVRKIHVDAKKSQEKGQKKSRKPRFTYGERLVEATESMWNAYSTIDSVVRQCETLGKPMIAGMSRWGIDVFGAAKDDGVDVTTLDDNSDACSSRDSGYHTPGSDVGPSDVRKAATRTKLITQPSIMNKGVELKDYQVVGLNWLNLLWENRISGILADDMGLGKTCQIIAFLSHLKMQGTGAPALVVVPGSTLENWCREFQKFSETVRFTPYYGSQGERYAHQETILHNIESRTCDVIITTYDLAHRDEDLKFLRRCRPEICIFDEGHILKNASTARYKSLNRIRTPCRILLTGTPLQNSLQELMSILGFLMPDVFFNKLEGGKENPVPEMLATLFKHKAKVSEASSHSTLLSAQRIQRARTMLTPFILRRKKAQVLKHLPKKTSRVEYCELTKTQKELYEQQLAKQRKILQDRAAGLFVKDHANVMMKLRQAAIHPLLFRHRYPDEKIRKMAHACLKEETFVESNPDIIFQELQLYQDYQCHQLASKYPGALKKFKLQNAEWMDSGKVAALLALLQQYKQNGDRALVFSQFTSVMDILGWVFDDHDIAFMRMDGSTPIAERQSLMDDFYADESIGVFMISTKSGGAGINLACANKVIIFDSSFNPQDDVQAENRAHRVGQTREVEVVRLVTRHTVEEQIYALGVSKLELDKMVQGEEADEGGKKKEKAGKDKKAEGLSMAEEAGIEAVEKMLLKQLEGGDVKEQFRTGLKKAGVNVAE